MHIKKIGPVFRKRYKMLIPARKALTYQCRRLRSSRGFNSRIVQDFRFECPSARFAFDVITRTTHWENGQEIKCKPGADTFFLKTRLAVTAGTGKLPSLSGACSRF